MGKIETFLASPKMHALLKRIGEVAQAKKEASMLKQRAIQNMRRALKSFLQEKKQ